MTAELKRIAEAEALRKSVHVDLLVVLADARRELSQFEDYVASWDPPAEAGIDPRAYASESVATRALEMLEAVSHVHTGSTRMMHLRGAQRRLVELAMAAGRAKP